MNIIQRIASWFRKPRPAVGFLAISPEAQRLAKAWRLARLNKDIDDCKRRLLAAQKAKKKSSHIRKEFEDLRTQMLREEG